MKKDSIFTFAAKTFTTFGFTILTINIFCLLIGDAARDYSSMFSLGSAGLSTATCFRFFVLCAIITAFRYVFFTDALIKNLPTFARTAGMFTSVIIVMIVFIILFNWFQVDNISAWAGFAICFAVSTALSTIVTGIKEKYEDKKLEEALAKLKGENNE